MTRTQNVLSLNEDALFPGRFNLFDISFRLLSYSEMYGKSASKKSKLDHVSLVEAHTDFVVNGTSVLVEEHFSIVLFYWELKRWFSQRDENPLFKWDGDEAGDVDCLWTFEYSQEKSTFAWNHTYAENPSFGEYSLPTSELISGLESFFSKLEEECQSIWGERI